MNPKSTISLGKINSVVIDLEVEVKNLSASVAQAVIDDTANEETIGPIGVKSFTVQTMKTALDPKTKKPITLKFRVPLEVTFNGKDDLQVQALAVDTNLPLMNIDWGYQRPMQLPEYVTYRKDPVTGKQIEVSDFNSAFYAQFEDQLAAKSQDLAKALQIYLKTYMAENGPEMLNEMAHEYKITSFMTNVYAMSPISSPDGQMFRTCSGA